MHRAAKYLVVAKGTALLSINSISVEQTRTPVEHYRALHRTDTSRLRLRVV
ncbi:UTRA domain-containing protein [Paracoccus sp. (in: a-proteobacteria)]|uniref:UTRA domain-containing protein n=1 Tax=Paracoccus sp. TaxID=267 RepID=UPI003A84361A